MKKIVSFVLGLITMSTLNAANTEVARITLTGQGGAESSYVTFRVDPAVTTPEETSFYGATDEVGQVNIYALNGANKCSAIKAADLSGKEIQIITNRRAAADQHYTMTFNVPTSTVGLKLYDRVAGKLIDITHSGTYEFDVTTALHSDFVAGTNYTVKDRFFIGEPTPSFCFKYNKLEIIGYQGKSLVIKGDAGEIDSQASLGVVYEKDLSAQPANTRLTVTLDGTDYLIDVNPTVTVVPAP